MGDWAELGSESACTDTPLTFKRKGHFNIGLYAKRRKLFLQELVDEKITADVKVKSLQNKLNYRKRKEMKEMEGKVYEVQGDSVTFECKLIPSDQKWMASMAGELNNAATYFSSFANVSKSNVKTIGDRAVINKANGDITQLPSITPMAKYMSLLKYKMKAGRLYKNVERWFREKKKAEDFQYRFTDMGIEL
ncbi:hypothetical protein QZH41_006934 [Actinostola sp. cb2023]|nr:hypothetical protein QZH41_006934 [Actinostola sp. cb2023]